MTRWFISDTHFGHVNILKYGPRPFETIREHDEFIVTMWNQMVKPNDHISHLGDITMERGGRVQKESFIKLIRSLHGHKRLYLGNHDHFPVKTYLEAGFEKILATWRDEQGILFSHIPLHPSSLSYTVRANVHGHIHGNRSPEPVMHIDKKTQRVNYRPYINISLEVTNYRPLAYEEIEARILAEQGEYQGVKVGPEVKL